MKHEYQYPMIRPATDKSSQNNVTTKHASYIGWLLFVCYIIFFASMFLTNEYWFATNFFLLVLSPLALIPIELSKIKLWGVSLIVPNRISFCNTFKTLNMARSKIFVGIFIFILSLSFSSWIYPEPTSFWFYGLLQISGMVLLFILVTARLSVEIPDFYPLFISAFAGLSLVNSLINLYDNWRIKNNLSEFIFSRFGPTFGHVPDKFYSNAALQYGIVILIAFFGINLVSNRSVKIFLLITSLVSLFSLFITQSRAPFFGFMCGAVLFIYLNFKFLRKWLYIIAPASFYLGYLMREPSQALSWRGLSHREFAWESFYKLLIERPIFGYGQRFEFAISLPTGEVVGHAHNMLMHAWVRGGFAAFLSLLFVLVFSLYKSFGFYQISKNLIPFGLATQLFFGGFFDNPINIFQADWEWICYWLPIGLWIGAETELGRHEFKDSFIAGP